MAKARSRTAARKVKDRWKAKSWYNILAPPSFDSVTIADTLADSPDGLINRVTGVSLQDITNDFRKSHIILNFKIHKVEESNAHTEFVGHFLTSDYLRRMIRRRKSKIDAVYDATTLDGASVRVKPFATTDKRIQNSQKRVIRESMKKTITEEAAKSTMSEFVKNILDGKIGSEIYKSCKQLYPVKRIEIYKTEIISQPTIMIADKKPKKEEKIEEETKETDKKEKKPTKNEEKKTEEVKEPEKKEEIPEKEEKAEKKPKELKKKEKSKKKLKKSTQKSVTNKSTAKRTKEKGKTKAKKPAVKKKKSSKKK